MVSPHYHFYIYFNGTLWSKSNSYIHSYVYNQNDSDVLLISLKQFRVVYSKRRIVCKQCFVWKELACLGCLGCFKLNFSVLLFKCCEFSPRKQFLIVLIALKPSFLFFVLIWKQLHFDRYFDFQRWFDSIWKSVIGNCS